MANVYSSPRKKRKYIFLGCGMAAVSAVIMALCCKKKKR